MVLVYDEIDEASVGFAAADCIGCLFLSNGLIRSDGFNVFVWNWL